MCNRIDLIRALWLGAIINVAVAWLCALTAPHRPYTTTSMTSDDIESFWSANPMALWQVDPDRFGALERAGVGASIQYHFASSTCGHRGYSATESMTASAVVLTSTTKHHPDIALITAHRHAHGLPWRALTCTQWGSGYGMRLEGGFEYHRAALGWQPSWPGFAANTAVYALALLVLGVCASRVRAAIRAFRGQCWSCAYDLRGGPHRRCPECDLPTLATARPITPR